MSVNVGVIGTGNMGAHHALTLHGYVNGARVTMLYDADAQRAEDLCEHIPGAKVASSALQVVDDPGTDALVIASPDATHAPLVLAALRVGKPVLCEKPLAPTTAECAAVVQAERQAVGDAGAPLVSMGFMRRFDPGYAEIKASLDARALGLPLLVHCASRGVSSGPGTTTESAIVGSAVHELDLIPWLLGEPIVAVGWHRPRSAGQVDGFQDPQLFVLRSRSDVVTTVELFLNARYGYDIRCEVVCEGGTLSLGHPRATVTNAEQMHYLLHPLDWRPRFADAYRLELQEWVTSIALDRPGTLAGAADATRAAEVADAIIASIGTDGRETAVEYQAL